MVCKGANPPFVVWATCFMWITSMFAITWSLVLFLFLGDLLVMSKIDVLNAIVLLSGLVMLPTNVHMLYSIANCIKMSIHTKIACCPLWLSITWIVLINLTGVGICIKRLYNCKKYIFTFIKLCMKDYRVNPEHKRFIDNIQWSLRCCGLNSYRDWFTQEWYDKTRDYEWDPYVLNLNSNALPQKKTDSVPLSCCKSGSCISNFLSELGTRSINTGGCKNVMKRLVLAALIGHLIFFITVALIELLVLRSIMAANKRTSCRKSNTNYTNCGSTNNYNVRQIMKARDNFDASSCSYQMHPDGSDSDSSVEYQEIHEPPVNQ